jgi:hypothetical protein
MTQADITAKQFKSMLRADQHPLFEEKRTWGYAPMFACDRGSKNIKPDSPIRSRE